MKLLIMIVCTVFLGGAAFMAAYLGFVQVPGISPINYGKPVAASNDPTGGLIWFLSDPLHQISQKADAAAKAQANNTPPPKPDPAALPKPELGDLKLATYWNGLETDQLIKLTDKWQTPALAKVLMKMDQDQVTAFLNALPAAKADQVSRAIQTLAAQPKPTPAQ